MYIRIEIVVQKDNSITIKVKLWLLSNICDLTLPSNWRMILSCSHSLDSSQILFTSCDPLNSETCAKQLARDIWIKYD